MNPIATKMDVAQAPKAPTITQAPAAESPKAPAPTPARDLNIH
jgi:hypothetical protein